MKTRRIAAFLTAGVLMCTSLVAAPSSGELKVEQASIRQIIIGAKEEVRDAIDSTNANLLELAEINFMQARAKTDDAGARLDKHAPVIPTIRDWTDKADKIKELNKSLQGLRNELHEVEKEIFAGVRGLKARGGRTENLDAQENMQAMLEQLEGKNAELYAQLMALMEQFNQAADSQNKAQMDALRKQWEEWLKKNGNALGGLNINLPEIPSNGGSFTLNVPPGIKVPPAIKSLLDNVLPKIAGNLSPEELKKLQALILKLMQEGRWDELQKLLMELQVNPGKPGPVVKRWEQIGGSGTNPDDPAANLGDWQAFMRYLMTLASGGTPAEQAYYQQLMRALQGLNQQQQNQLLQVLRGSNDPGALLSWFLQLLQEGKSPAEALQIISSGNPPPTVVDEFGNPLTVPANFDGSPQEGVEKIYGDGVEGGLLVSETKIRRTFKPAGAMPGGFVAADESMGDRQLNLVIQEIREAREELPDSLIVGQEIKDLSNPNGSHLTVNEWIVKSPSGQTQALPGGSRARVTFKESGEYEITAKGTTDWGSPFTVTTRYPVAF